ncbi:ABC transporter permease [Spirochaetia bacterium]|nr:ABC transporter permease [Spirochaetia bacterium]
MARVVTKRTVIRKKKSSVAEFSMIRPATNVIFHIVLFVYAVTCILPVLLVVAISMTEEHSIADFGYRFIPKVVSLEGYVYIFQKAAILLNGLKNSIMVVVVGTVVAILLQTSMGYVLSRREFKLHKLYTYIVFLPMLFGGGMIASYFINTQFLHLNNTFWALVLPGAVGGFNIIICRTFFQSNITDAVSDSARVDGAGEFTIYFKLILPLALPVVATIGLFACFAYWNDWFTGLLYLSDMNKYTLQLILQKILNDINLLNRMMDKMPDASTIEALLKLPREGTRMAIVLLITLPIVCAYPFFQRYFVSGLTIGSVKD